MTRYRFALFFVLFTSILTATAHASEPTGDTEYTIRTSVREVVLHLGVVDGRTKSVPDLAAGDVTLYENGKPVSQFSSFQKEENLPLKIGILIDGSGSVKRIWQDEAKAADAFLARIMRPGDIGFVATFTDRVDLVQDWTNDIGKMQAAIHHGDTDGASAIYDAVFWGEHKLTSERSEQPSRTVLLLVTDMWDNRSTATLADIKQMLERSEVLLYSVGLGFTSVCSGIGTDCVEDVRAIDTLKTLSKATGGTAYFPRQPGQFEKVGNRITEDLRTFYRVSYAPPNPAFKGYRHLNATVASNGRKLKTHHRSGYSIFE